MGVELGYDTYEDKRDFKKEGITGTVTKYTKEKLTYPCYVINQTKELPIQAFKTNTLMKMFAVNTQVLDEEEAKLKIGVYFSQDENIIRLGQLSPKQVKPFLSLFEKEISAIDCYYDKDTKLTQEMLYVLAE